MITQKEIKIYQTADNKSPFYDWINRVKDKTIRARINRRLDRLSLGNLGDFKTVGGGVFEMRLQFGAGYRIYFAEINNQIVLLLSGGDKSSQHEDIKLAQQYWHDFKRRVLP